MAPIQLSRPWTERPQEAADVASAFAPFVSAARNLTNAVGYTQTGGSFATSPAGVGYLGNGTSDLLARSVSMTPAAGIWIHAYFVHGPNVDTTARHVLQLGSSAVSNGSILSVNTGSVDGGYITAVIRTVDSGGAQRKLMPITATAGQIYSVVAVFPTGLAADSFIFVNGKKYTTSESTNGNDVNFGSTSNYVNESVNAGKRGTTTNFANHKVIQGAYGVKLPESLAQALSSNPTLLWEPRRIWVPGLSVGGAGTNLASSGGALQASAVGTLTTKAALSGAGTLAASGTGALSTGSLGTNLASSGGLLQASAVGTLTTKAALAGAGTLAASGTGALSTGSSGTNLASSGGLLQASAVGTLTTKAALAGAGALAASGAGTLSTGSSGATLASSGGLLPASGSGSLATRAALQATLAIAQAGATAALTVRALLAGAGLAACRGTGTLALDGTGLDVFTTSGRARVGATALEATPGRIGSSPFATTAARRIGGRSL